MSHSVSAELEQASTQAPQLYVRVDEHGVLRVGNTRVMLDSVVAGFTQGHSAETIQQQYSSLSLEEVYGAIAWYLAHVDEASQYLTRQHAVWSAGREETAKRPSPVVQRLRSLQKLQGSQPS